jgi:predicted RNA-binding protein with PUA-like domain
MAHLDTNSNQQQQNQTEILEYGDIYFFYRPKVRSEEVKGIEDVRTFFMVTAPEEANNDNKSQLYRLFVIGKKSLPKVERLKLEHLKDIGPELVVFLKMLMS